MTTIYTLSTAANDYFYVGHTVNLPDRLIGHKLQAIRDYRTDKDKFIYSELLTGDGITLNPLFASPFYTTNDETFMMYFFQEVLGFNLLNTSLGQGVLPLDRLMKLPGISPECESIARMMCEAAEVEFPKVKTLEPRVGAVNTVTMNSKMTLMVIEVADVKLVKNKFGGENTPIIKYKWLNTNRSENANKVHPEPYTDSLHHCHDMKVGDKYAIWTKKVPAPESATSMMWSWEDRVPFDAQWRATQLTERLERIDTMTELKPEFRSYLKSLRADTHKALKNLDNWNLWK